MNTYVQKEETLIFTTNEFNLDLPTGANILNMILKLCNDTYDFSKITKVVNTLA